MVNLIWYPEDALAGLCTVAEIGHARPVAGLQGPQDVQAMARHLAPHVLASMALLARSGGHGAVEAARLVLLYGYGPPGSSSAVQPPAPAGWQPSAGRLSYADMPGDMPADRSGRAN